MDDDPSVGRFLDLDGTEVNSGTVVDAVDFIPACREGLGGGAWFRIGSTPVSHISYAQVGTYRMLTVEK